MFKSKNKKEAQRRINTLKNKTKFLPPSVATMVNRIHKNFEQLTLYYDKEYQKPTITSNYTLKQLYQNT